MADSSETSFPSRSPMRRRECDYGGVAGAEEFPGVNRVVDQLFEEFWESPGRGEPCGKMQGAPHAPEPAIDDASAGDKASGS